MCQPGYTPHRLNSSTTYPVHSSGCGFKACEYCIGDNWLLADCSGCGKDICVSCIEPSSFRMADSLEEHAIECGVCGVEFEPACSTCVPKRMGEVSEGGRERGKEGGKPLYFDTTLISHFSITQIYVSV